MNPHTEMIEGPEAAERFHSFVGKILKVPASVIRERHMQATFERSMDQKRRGPKPKGKPPASHGPVAA